MSKIQGKQIADNTITQGLLNLATPLSGDTTSGATVGYVNSRFMGGENITIGPAEDGDLVYTDGIFTDFTSGTTIGTAVDRFNEMLLLLAPAPPTNWNNALSNLNVTATKYTPRALTTGAGVSNMISSTTPTPSVSSLVGIQAAARATNGTFTLLDQGSTIETNTITNLSTSKTSGYIRYTIADPYQGEAGKAGFWTGVTAFSFATTLPAITPSITQRTLQLNHPGTDSPETFLYYVDSPLSVGIGTISATMPSMSGYVSGVPTLASGQQVTAIGFSITNVSSYFYAPSYVWSLTAGLVGGTTGDPDSIPTANAETGTVTNKTATVLTNQFSDTSFSFTIVGRNSTSTPGSGTAYTNSAYRVDTVSNETVRKTSGAGSYPATGWGGTYDSTQSLLSGNYVNELQLRNGIYVYPTVNYTTQGGPNYSTATGTRWVTFNLGSFTAKGNFTITFAGATNITSSPQANLLIEVLASGSTATKWINADAAYGGVGDPGSSAGVDGVSAATLFTTNSRNITFGTQVLTGNLVVRVGLTAGSNVTFTGLSKTDLS